MNDHQSALRAALDAAMGEITQAADSTRAVIDGDIQTLHEMTAVAGRPPLIADVPIDEPPPYVPPPMTASANALIPDTPLVESPASSSSAFDDDAPLWQS